MNNLIPTNNGFPSNLGSGIFAPNLALQEGEIQNFSQIPEESGIGDKNLDYMVTPHSPSNMLLSIRTAFPHLPILPIPTNVVSVSLVAGIAKDIAIKDGAIMCIFLGDGGYYVSANGNAEIPSVVNEGTAQSMYAPEGFAFFCDGKKSFSCISANTGTIVTLLFYSQNDLPR